jgi:hypothetical protein
MLCIIRPGGGGGHLPLSLSLMGVGVFKCGVWHALPSSP